MQINSQHVYLSQIMRGLIYVAIPQMAFCIYMPSELVVCVCVCVCVFVGVVFREREGSRERVK